MEERWGGGKQGEGKPRGGKTAGKNTVLPIGDTNPGEKPRGGGGKEERVRKKKD